MRIALYQPDIPQNTGTLLRLAACMDMGLDLIEPAGFVLDDKKLRRAGMDYIALARMTRHNNFDDFLARLPGRLILLTTKSAQVYTDFAFEENDTLMLGSESSGVPDDVHNHDRLHARLTIPMHAETRSLNIAVAGAMVLGEALRQTGLLHKLPPTITAHAGTPS